jgi:NTP pyrophosphatase (non-canonical NTP hydrolase)
MTFNEYSIAAAKTAKYPQDVALAYLTLGLTGEAGEVANKYKKVIRGDDNGELTFERISAMRSEIGDCLWYLARLADELGTNLETIAKENIVKLASRDERGTIQSDGDVR